MEIEESRREETGDRRQETEVRGRKSEVRIEVSGVRCQEKQTDNLKPFEDPV